MAPPHDYRELIAFLNTTDTGDRQRTPHRLPLPCYTLSDREFFFTICARHQRCPFLQSALVGEILDALRWYRERYQWRLFAYCLMPDHLHFIAQIAPESPGLRPGGILDWVGNFKSYTTRIWWRHGGQGRLWQRSSYDRVIRYNDSVEEAVRYVLGNPVRKGLVAEGETYPYAGMVDAWC